jgi:hypothetical protein
MKYVKLVLSIIGLTCLGVGVGLILTILGIRITGFSTGGNGTLTNRDIESYPKQAPGFVAASYAAVSFEEMAKRSQVILAGQVTNIGETKWNQDNGSYWEETVKDDIGETTIAGLPYYEVTILPEQIILDSVGTEGQLVITVIGTSPANSQEAGMGDFSLKPGNEVVVFVRQGQLAWRSGEVTYDQETNSFDSGHRSVLFFMGNPDSSYLLKGADDLYRSSVDQEQASPLSLDELIKVIEEIRELP